MTQSEQRTGAPQRVLITGGAGFVGAALAERLARDGVRVTCLDLADGTRLRGLAGVELVHGSVLDAALVHTLVANADLVFHLAAVVGVVEYLVRPAEVMQVTLDGTRNAVAACLAHRVPLVFSSTSEAYGKNTALLAEDADSVFGPATSPRWSYGIAKLAAEHWCRAHAPAGLQFALVRYFNVYGPGIDAPGSGRVISKFLGRLRDGLPLELVDGGAAVRSYCYVDDAVHATWLLGSKLYAGEPAVQEQTVNIGSGEPITVRQLAEAVARVADQPVEVVDVAGSVAFGPNFAEIPHRAPDLSKLERLLGPRATVPLDEGLRRTLRANGLPVREASQAPTSAPPWLPFVRSSASRPLALGLQMAEILRSGRVTNHGPQVQALERAVQAYLGAPHAVALVNGSAALSMAALVLGLRGQVALPSYTFGATWSAFALLGLSPVFCDVDPQRWTLDPADLERKLAANPKVSAVVAVNVFGVPPDLPALAQVCKAHKVALIYDNCHGFGSVDRGQRWAPEPDVTVHSLHTTKVLAGVEGGLLLTPHAALAARAAQLRNHGIDHGAPFASLPGPNAKMDELRACVALSALDELDQTLARRRGYASQLASALPSRERGADGHAQAAPKLQWQPPEVEWNAQNFALDFRGLGESALLQARAHFAAHGIETRRYFYPALHQLEAVQPQSPLPVAESLAQQVLCLPLYNQMHDVELARLQQALASLMVGSAP